jgi:hypothetical protein
MFMLALAYDQLTWAAIGLAFMLGVWVLLRAWVRRPSVQNSELRKHFNDGSLSPRGHHYYFAHIALRALAAEDPERLITALASPDAEGFLLDLWNAVNKEASQGGEEDIAVSPEGLEAIPARVAGRSAALVILPPPRAATEAYFVAIVLNHELDEPAKPAPEPEFYYFTLEKGVALDASTRTIFCQWEDACHKNYGDGPPADGRAFLDHIARHLAATPAPQASFHPGKHKSHGPPKN